MCFVAHNGNMYDFPLIQAQLVKQVRNLDWTITHNHCGKGITSCQNSCRNFDRLWQSLCLFIYNSIITVYCCFTVDYCCICYIIFTLICSLGKHSHCHSIWTSHGTDMQNVEIFCQQINSPSQTRKCPSWTYLGPNNWKFSRWTLKQHILVSIAIKCFRKTPLIFPPGWAVCLSVFSIYT